MTYNAKLTALHKGLTPIHADQDRINFAPKLAEDIRIQTGNHSDGTNKYLVFNKVYTSNPATMTQADIDYPELVDTVWTISDIDGWWNLPEPQMPSIERGFGDGSFDVSGRFTARDMTLSGSVIITASDRATIAAKSKIVRETIISAFNLVKKSTWLIVDEDEFKRASNVRLSGRPNISTVNSRGRIDFSIGLRAADPTKYEWIDLDVTGFPVEYEVITGNGYNLAVISSETNYAFTKTYPTYNAFLNQGVYEYAAEGYDTSVYSRNYFPSDDIIYGSIGGTVSVYNHGTANVYPYIRIIGPLYGPASIKNVTTDQTMNLIPPAYEPYQILYPSESESLVQFIDIDTRIKEVHKGDFSNGEYENSARSSLEPLVDWIYLQPGENTLSFSDSGTQTISNTPIFQIYWRSGWDG